MLKKFDYAEVKEYRWKMTEEIKVRVGDNKVRVAIYGRVSTDKEAQIYALKNQKQWCKMQVEKYSEWNAVEKYFDEGITGTQAKKRPNFMKMIKDAERGKFDIIITREVSRFGRNIKDVINYVSLLEELGIEVVFIDDGISTFVENESEQLAYMAIAAQRESRKISERVKSGQAIARKNNVLYGSGNIIGYDRDGRTFKINKEQAKTVKLIFKLYLEGNGLRRIKEELLKKGRKNSRGQVRWYESTISSILENKMYIGKQYQNKTTKKHFLKSEIIINDKSEYILIEPNENEKFEPIISEEDFNKVHEIKNKRYTRNAKGRGHGIKESKDKWMQVLQCDCGAKFQQYKCKKNEKTGIYEKQYVCRNRKKNGTIDFRVKNNLPLDEGCDRKTILGWHLELMIKDILTQQWSCRVESVREVLSLIEENYEADYGEDTIEEKIKEFDDEVKQHEGAIDRLVDMYECNEITREKFKEKKSKHDEEIYRCKKEILKIKPYREDEEKARIAKIEEIEKALKNMIDLEGKSIDSDLISSLVEKVIIRDDYTYEWYLNMGRNTDDIFDIAPNEKLEVKRERSLDIRNKYYEKILSSKIMLDRAMEYRKQSGTYVRTSDWHDLEFEVYIR